MKLSAKLKHLREDVDMNITLDRDLTDGFNRVIEDAEYYEEITASPFPWISVDEKPLVVVGEGTWTCTDDGEGELLVAVQTNRGWWVRHCVIEDRVGLCLVGEDENEPAGWDVTEVTHYIKINHLIKNLGKI